MARYEMHYFQAGDSRTIDLPERPDEVLSWYGQGEPRQPYIIRHNVMGEDVGHDWSWREGKFRYSGTKAVGESQGVDLPRDSVVKPFWLIFQYGEAEEFIRCSCGRELEPMYVFCPYCGARRY
ncbi:MAG: hypothetical protein A2Y38_06565 [Spirochaetes bacterium GWB1_59_5]|nr:MAG: hypothetical protein A2Y38_06565 [Spirochaetes bacterium GWB1_59_5]